MLLKFQQTEHFSDMISSNVSSCVHDCDKLAGASVAKRYSFLAAIAISAVDLMVIWRPRYLYSHDCDKPAGVSVAKRCSFLFR